MVKLNDILDAFNDTIGYASSGSSCSNDNICVTICNENKVQVGVLSPRQHAVSDNKVMSFSGYVPKERKKNLLTIWNKSLSFLEPFDYYVEGTVQDSHVTFDRSVLVPSLSILKDASELLINLNSEPGVSPTQLALRSNKPLIRYNNGPYEHLTNVRWLDTTSPNLSIPTNSITDGILIDVRCTQLVALDMDRGDNASFNDLVNYIRFLNAWHSCYIYRSSTNGTHAYLLFSVAVNAMRLFKESNPICDGYKKWITGSGFQVIRRGPKFNKPNSDITQIAVLKRQMNNTVLLTTNISCDIGMSTPRRYINLRSPE